MKNYTYASLIALTLCTTAALADDKKSDNTPKISGVIEVEAGFQDGNSDLSLATVELGIDHSLNNKADAHLLLLYEDGEDIAVDEATITLHPRKNISISAGRMYVPFGQFDSNMVSSPLTQELGETQEEALQLGISSGHFNSALYVFKDSEDGSDKIDDFGINIGYETDPFSVGLSYISDVNDKSSAIQAAKGIAAHAKTTIGRMTLIAEHLSINKTADGKKPQASNLELGIDMGADSTLGFTVQQTKNADALELPKKSFGIAYSLPVYENVGLAVEVVRNKGYDKKKDTIATLQLSYEF